jgi:hypothetical protein
MGLIPLEKRDIFKEFNYSLIYDKGPPVNPLNPLIKAVSLLLIEPALILVWGEWKTGKTDFALLMSEIAQANEVVDIVKTNIGQEEYEQIQDYETLKEWLHSEKKTPYEGQDHLLKLFIYDELNVHTPSRRGLARKNVGLQTILPEVSKAKARMILVCQNPKSIDKFIKDPNWLKGGFRKKSREVLGSLELLAPHISLTPIPFNGVPPSHIEFNPYETAPMRAKRTFEAKDIMDEEFQKLYLFAKGEMNYLAIKSNPQSWARWRNRHIIRLIEFWRLHTIQKDGGVYIHRKRENEPGHFDGSGI